MNKRDLGILAAVIILAAVLAASIFSGAAAETASWGLSFRTPGAPPVGTADNAALRKLDAAFMGDPGEKVIFLTFDAGYENGHTEKILDTLQSHDVKAAFFLVGDYVERNADLTRRMVTDGHIVGNHTMDHPDISENPDKLPQQLKGMEDLFREVTGSELPKFYRPPMGKYTEENLKTAKELGYKTVFWSLAYADWDQQHQPDPEAAVKKLLERTHNGMVVLLHSTSETNAEILDTLISRWKDLGYRFGTLEELFGGRQCLHPISGLTVVC